MSANSQFNQRKMIFAILVGLIDDLDNLLTNSADHLRDKFKITIFV